MTTARLDFRHRAQTTEELTHCGVLDVQRDDDKADVIKNRLDVYHSKTKPLVDYYDEQGLMRRIDGTREAADVNDHIRAVIATLKLEENV